MYIHTQLRTLGCTRSCARRSACCPCATSSAAESSSCTGASFPRSRKHELANQLHSHMYIYICIYIYIYIALTAGRPLFWRAARLRQQWFTPLPACLAPTLVYLAFVRILRATFRTRILIWCLRDQLLSYQHGASYLPEGFHRTGTTACGGGKARARQLAAQRS